MIYLIFVIIITLEVANLAWNSATVETLVNISFVIGALYMIVPSCCIIIGTRNLYNHCDLKSFKRWLMIAKSLFVFPYAAIKNTIIMDEAIYYHNSGDTKKAIELMDTLDLKSMLRFKSGRKVYCNNMIVYYSNVGKIKEARQLLDENDDLITGKVISTKAYLLFREGKIKESLAIYEKEIRKPKNNYCYACECYELALIYDELKDKKALEYYEKTVKFGNQLAIVKEAEKKIEKLNKPLKAKKKK